MSQKFLSADSDSNEGSTFRLRFAFFIVPVPFGPGLVSRRDNADQGASDGEHHKELSRRVGSTEDVITFLDLGVRIVVEDEERLIEEDLLTLFVVDVVFLPILGVVPFIPFESDELGKVDQLSARSRMCPSYTPSRLGSIWPELGARETQPRGGRSAYGTRGCARIL